MVFRYLKSKFIYVLLCAIFLFSSNQGVCYALGDNLGNTTSGQAWLDTMPVYSTAHYTGNLGDSGVEAWDPLNDIDIQGNKYEHGLKYRLARWNSYNESSWAYNEYKLDGSCSSFTGKVGIYGGDLDWNHNRSPKSVLKVYGDGILLYTSDYITEKTDPLEFKVSIKGVNILRVAIEDVEPSCGGTIFALVNPLLGSQGNTSFAVRVFDSVTNKGIADAKISSDGNTYITDSYGTARISLATSCLKNITISKPGYNDYSSGSYNLMMGKINEIPLTKSGANTLTITPSSFNVGSISNDTLNGPSIDIGGKSFNLFSLPIGLDFNAFDNIDVKYDAEEKKYTVLIGHNEDTDTSDVPDPYWKKDYQEIKEAVNFFGGSTDSDFYNKFRKMRSKLKKLNLKMGFDFDAYACGYMEFTDNNGTPQFTEGGLLVVASSDFSLSYPFPAAPVVYMKFGLEGEANGKFRLVLKDSGQMNPQMDVNAELKFTLTPSLGVGIGNDKIANLEAGIQGELESTLNLPATASLQDSFSSTFTGSLYLSYKTLMFINGKKKWDFASIPLYPSSSQNLVQPQYKAAPSISIQPSDLVLMPRNYASSTSTVKYKSIGGSISQGGSLNTVYTKDNVYPYGEPKLVPLSGGRQLMVWVEDNLSRTSANRTALMYSVFDGSTWSAPQYVNDDGTADFGPSLAVSGGNAYLVWQNANSVFSDSVTLSEMEQSMDIYYARFDGSSFVDVTNLTPEQETNYEISPVITADNGEISAAWISNSANDPFELQGTNSIYRKKCTAGNWGQAEQLVSGLPLITNIDSSYDNGTNLIAYSADADGNTATSNDSQVFLIKDNQKYQVTGDDMDNADVQFVRHGDTTELYWKAGGEIKYAAASDYTNINTIQIQGSTGSLTNLHILQNDNDDKAVIWEQEDGFKNELYGAYYDKNTSAWGSAIKLSDLNQKIRQSYGYLNSDGTIKVAFDLAQVLELTDTNSDPYGNTSLMVADIKKQCDISVIDGVSYDSELVKPGSTITLGVSVKNNGAEPVDQLNAEVLDEYGNVLSTQVVTNTIASGAVSELEVSYLLPDNLNKLNIKVRVTPAGATDINMNDNTVSAGIGFADIMPYNVSASNENGISHIQATIENVGYDEGQNINVTLRKGSFDGDIVETKTITALAAGSSQEVSFDVNNSTFGFQSEYDSKLLYISVDTQSPELLYGNNSSTVVVEPTRVSGIALDNTNLELPQNGRQQLQAAIQPLDAVNKLVVWLSNDESVASVDSNGVVTALKVGTATITAATVDGSKTAACEVTVMSNNADVNKDGAIDVLDIAAMGKGYNSKSGDSNWNDAYDLNKDGAIDVYDLVITLKFFLY